MARALPLASTTAETETPTRDWQALRGELVALLDQMEGHYDHDELSGSGLAQRVRDLRSQVVESDPDNRRREALRSVKRQLDRFSDRSEHDAPGGENALQSAIAQIRARAPVPLDAPALRIPSAPPRYDDMAHTMSVLSNRLGELEGELSTQRSSQAQVREIADQVGQLSGVVELLAGSVGETGQVKRLETQIADLANLIGKGQQVDLSQLTERLDQVAATVDRLADLQVQQIQHVVREAESNPQKDAEAARGIKAIEASLRSLYDRFDALESSMGAPAGELERISDMLGQIGSRLSFEGSRPDRLLGLVDALNGRIKEIEDTGYNLGSLRGDLGALRDAVIGAIEPRFSAIEQQLGDIGERLDSRTADGPGIAQVEAQIRQLVARMDQTGEQLSLLAQQPAAAQPDFETLATLTAKRTAEALSEPRNAPNLDELADRVAARTQKAMAARQRLPAAELEAMADLIAGRTRAALADRDSPATGSELSQASLAEIEERVSRLVDGFLRAQASAAPDGVSEGMQHVESRLAQLETALGHRSAEPLDPVPVLPQETARPMASKSAQIHSAVETAARSPEPRSANDMMPRDPAIEAPLKEFGFPDLGPVRAALEARGGRARPVIAAALEMPAAMAPEPATTAAISAEPTEMQPPPRPQSIFDREVNSAFEAPIAPTTADATPVPPSSRNTFIEAARRSAQRQNAIKTSASPDSPIGRALSRLQTANPEKPVSAPEPVPMASAVPQAKSKAKKRNLLSRARQSSKVEPVVLAPAPEPAPAPVEATTTADRIADSHKTPRESFLTRHRRAILLSASVVAIAFMTLNLIEQRLAPADDQSAASSPAVAMVDPVANPAATTSPPKAMAATPVSAPAPAETEETASLSNKPTSPALQLAIASQQPATTSPDAEPRIRPAADPTTTASISPDEVSAAGSSAPLSPMPPSLAAQPAPTAPAAATPEVVAPGPTATLPTSAPAAPPVLQSPVKVDLPPSSLGPLQLRQAAANGDARSQFEVGAIYSEGRLVPQDFKQASAWYERAAEQGFVPAEYRLGNLYETGKGVTKDYEQAHLWYQRAAEAGNRMAMHNLAALYAGGQFGKQDFASAANWFEQAANQGIRDSQFNLGMLYARGLGVPQNLATSYKWFALAASSGDTGAAKARDDVARSLDAAQLKDAKAQAATFKLAAVNLAANFAPIGTWDKTFNPGPTITTKAVVLKVQQALSELGYDVGTPDGQSGAKTAQAIKSFEQGTGMSQVGAINPRLLAVLGSQPV